MKLKRINSISAVLWAISCFFFAFIIVFTTKGMTHDPNFSGGPETPWLLPMLGSVGLGAISFGSMILTWIIIMVKKDKSEYKAPLGLTTKKAVFSVVLLGIVGIVFLVGYRNANFGYKKSNYTGQQLFDSMNEYRIANGKPELKLDPYICDNLVARYLKVKSGDVGHEGFEEWVKNEEIDKKFAPIAELYIKGYIYYERRYRLLGWLTGPQIVIIG